MLLEHFSLQNETRLTGHHVQHLPDIVFVHLLNQLLDTHKLLKPERLSAAKHADDVYLSETAV